MWLPVGILACRFCPLMGSTPRPKILRDLWHNSDANAFGLRDHASAQSLEAESTESQFRLLDSCNVVDVLQADLPNNVFSWIHGTS